MKLYSLFILLVQSSDISVSRWEKLSSNCKLAFIWKSDFLYLFKHQTNIKRHQCAVLRDVQPRQYLSRNSVCNNNPEQVHQNYFPCEVMSQISGGPMFYFASWRWSPPFSTLCTEFAARSKAPPLFMRAMAQAPLNSGKIFHCNLLQCCKRLMCFDCARGLWLASSLLLQRGA